MQNALYKIIRYYIYVRKSSESEERQVQSLGDQIDRLTKMAAAAGLEVVEIFSEAKSAKSPGNRPIFDEMLKKIEAGEANGILCWEINRLTRNPVDSGKIQWLSQQGILQSIRTMTREYKPDDNALILSVESGSANQFILDLKRGVRRGLDSKVGKGQAPILAPLGYLNTKTEIRGENYIIKDPDRFNLIRKAWDLMLTGNYSPTKILDIANNEWGLRTRKMKRKGSRPIGRSTIYRMFTNPFYAGLFSYRGEIVQGVHDPMITLDEFDTVQVILGREGKPRPKTHHFFATGIIRCAECGSAISALEKTKFIKKTAQLKRFAYYFCTRRKLGCKCTQNKYLAEEELEEQIKAEIRKITILPEFKELALEILRENNNQEIESRTAIYENQLKAVTEAQGQLDNLTKMRYRELIDDQEFLKEKKLLQGQISTIQQKMRGTEDRAQKWLDLTEQTFEFACYANTHFESGDIMKKKEIFRALGQNFLLKNQKLQITPNEWLIPIIDKYPAIEKQYQSVRTGKYPTVERQMEAFASICPMMRE